MRAKRFNKKGKVFFAVACHLMCQPPLNQRVERGGELAVFPGFPSGGRISVFAQPLAERDLTVAVGFIPRKRVPATWRRGATLEISFRPVFNRRSATLAILCCLPWLEQPRLPSPGRSATGLTTEMRPAPGVARENPGLTDREQRGRTVAGNRRHRDRWWSWCHWAPGRAWSN